MKLSLQLKLGQHLAMTPQLQQAIKLLQLSNFDLHQEVEQMLESNPMLELEEATDETGKDYGRQSTIADNWQEYYPSSFGGSSWDGEPFDFEFDGSREDSLQDHLLWQLNLTPMSDQDRSIALTIIDAIDSNGMLSVDIDSIMAGFDPDAGIGPDEVLAVLHRIQQFDPIGVGSRDLSECLLLQLEQITDPELERQTGFAKRIVKDYLNLLASRDYAQLMRRASGCARRNWAKPSALLNR